MRYTMHFSIKQKRWAAVLLICVIGIAGVYLGTRSCPQPHSGPDRTGAQVLSIMMEACQTSAAPNWKRLSSATGAERALTHGMFRGFLDGCYQVKSYSGAYTRIKISSGRVENVCARSHTLIMNYIHCKDGAKHTPALAGSTCA